MIHRITKLVALSLAVLACGGESTTKHRARETGGSAGDATGGTSGGGTGGTAGSGASAGDGATAGTAGGGVTAEDFPHRFAENHCQSLAACCDREGIGMDPATCTSTLEGILGPAFRETLARQHVEFDSDAAARCLEAYREALEACDDRELAQRIDQACQYVFRGTVPEGGACTDDGECAPTADGGYVLCDEGSVCRHPPDDPGGTSTHAGLGETCGSSCTGGTSWAACTGAGAEPASLAVCYAEDGLYCSPALVCEPAPGAGDPCPTFACAKGAYCVDGTCVAGTDSGPCSVGYECSLASHCDFGTERCVQSRALGQNCTDSADCVSDYCSHNVCRNWSLATPETCAGTDVAGAY